MTHRISPSILVAICLVAGGCAVQGDPFSRAKVPPGGGVVYVYRPYSYAGSLISPEVTCGDQNVKIGPGGYHAFIVPASSTMCRVEGGESTDEIAIDPSPRVRYIHEEIGWGLLIGHPHLDPVDADEARTEIRNCCVEQR